MAADELQVLLTAKDELSGKLKDVRAAVKATEKAMTEANDEFRRTGDKSALARYEALRVEMEKLYATQRKLSAENARAAKRVKDYASQSQTAAAKVGRAWAKAASVFNNNWVAGLSAAGVILFGKQAVTAFAEAEKSQMQLQLAYEKFPAVADVSIESMRALNDEIMGLTGADDDLLAASEAVLARFDLTGTQIQSLIPLVNDLAIAKGQTLTDASQAVGLALMGNARAVKSLGIAFKPTGDRAADLATIMDALTEKVGGTGEAFGETAAGQLAIAQANFENLQESVGQVLVPALEALVSVVGPLSKWFANLSEPVRTAAVVIAGVGTAALIATPRIIMLKAAMTQAGISGGSLTAGLKSMAGAMAGPWGVALVAGGIALTALISHFQKAQEEADRLKASLDAQTGATTDRTRAEMAARAEAEGMLAITEDAGLASSLVIDAIMGNAGAYIALENAARGTGGPINDVVNFVGNMRTEMIGAQGDTDRVNRALGVTATNADAAAAATNREAAALLGLADAFKAVNKIMGRHQAMRSYRTALDEYIKNPSVESGEAVIAAMETAANSIKDPERRAKFLKGAIGDVRDALKDSGLKGGQLKYLRRLLGLIKGAADDAVTSLSLIGSEVDKLRGASFDITVTYEGGKPVQMALGGLVTGPGTGTSDSVPALLSNGEYVVRAAAVKAIGVDALHRLNRADSARALERVLERRHDTARVLERRHDTARVLERRHDTARVLERMERVESVPPIVVRGGDGATATAPSGATVNIGAIHADRGVDVQAEVLHAMMRADRIARERR